MFNLTAPSRLTRGLVLAAVAVGFLAVLAVGLHFRTQGMYPVSQGLLYETDYDEGVNTAAGQLLLQGYMPYRDYMFAHPPLAVLLFAGVLQFHFVPWGDATAFVYERYAAIACGLLAILGVFALARLLGGTLAGLVASGLLAVDGLAVEIDRRAMLEPYVNGFSTLAILCYVWALKRERSRAWWLVAAGALGACAALIKTVGVLALATLLFYASVRLMLAFVRTRVLHAPAYVQDSIKARVLEMVWIVTGVAIVVVPLLGYFFIASPDAFVKQVYIFQLVRPADGTSSVLERFAGILGSEASHLTIYLAGAGLGLVILRSILRRNMGHWGLILIWTGTIVALFAFSSTFFPHYYVQLAVPLCILGGSLVSRENLQGLAARGPSPNPKERRKYRIALSAQVALCLIVVVTNWGAAQTQFVRAEAVATFQSNLLRDVSRVLATRTAPSGHLLAFHPAFALAASRELVGPGDGRVMIDSYGYMQYLGLGLDGDEVPEDYGQGVMDLLHGEQAQAKMEEIAAHADYILFEQRAGWQLNPETITAMTNGYHLIYTKGKVSLWAKN